MKRLQPGYGYEESIDGLPEGEEPGIWTWVLMSRK